MVDAYLGTILPQRKLVPVTALQPRQRMPHSYNFTDVRKLLRNSGNAFPDNVKPRSLQLQITRALQSIERV